MLHALAFTLITAASLGAPLASHSTTRNAPIAPQSQAEELQLVQDEDQSWYFSGTARYYSDIWDEEKSMWVSGHVDASSRGEAMEYAREAGRAQAASRGRVISVDIETLF